MIERWEESRCENFFSGTHTRDWAHMNKTTTSRCQSIDSRKDDQGAEEGTKTSSQKVPGREVAGNCGTLRNRTRSDKLLKKTCRAGSSSCSSLSRGTGPGRWTLSCAVKTSGAWFMDTRWRGEKTYPIIAPFGHQPMSTRVTGLQRLPVVKPVAARNPVAVL